MAEPKYQTGAALLEAFKHDLWHGEAPERWPMGTGPLASDIDFGPGQIVLIGGAPGQGKTAFAMAAMCDALEAVPDLKALVCNVEMPASVLLERQLARLSGIPLDTIQARRVKNLAEQGQARIKGGLARLAPIVSRVAFLEAPFALAHAYAAAQDFGARCIVLDYLQRIRPPVETSNQRESIEALMQHIRNWATEGAGILALSAVARQNGKGGSTYENLNGASFRGASELEFAADSAYILNDGDTKDGPDLTALKCFKRRNGEPKDMLLRFEKAYQRFSPVLQDAPAGSAPWEGVSDDENF